MDSQRTVDHLRDEASVRKDTTLGELLDTAAEELEDAEDTIERQAKELKKANDWINNAVVACNKRGCSSLERRLRETNDLIEGFQKERDAALAEVKRLKGEVEWREKRDEKQSDMIRTIDPLYR